MTTQDSHFKQSRINRFMKIANDEKNKVYKYMLESENRVGACIARGDLLIGSGHSKLPDWFDETADYSKDFKLYITSATLDAYITSGIGRLDGCTLYVTQFPTNLSTKLILQVGIKEIVYPKGEICCDEDDIEKAKEMFIKTDYEFIEIHNFNLIKQKV